jgi:hypothetical protein
MELTGAAKYEQLATARPAPVLAPGANDEKSGQQQVTRRKSS